MRTLVALALSAALLVSALADTPGKATNVSPSPVVEASRALREFKSESYDPKSPAMHGAIAVVVLTEEQLLKRWSIFNMTDERSRNAVLRNIEELQQRVDRLYQIIATQLGTDELNELRTLHAKFDSSARDFRLKLETAFR